MISTLLVPLLASVAPAAPLQVTAQEGQPPIPVCEGETIKLESGVEYCVLKAGDPAGKRPGPSDLVKVDYTGWLTNGTSFDSSRTAQGPRRPARPAEFGVGQVIPGWTEALSLMVPGDHWLVTIPAALGYAEKGSPPNIGPNEDLIFEVELLDVVARGVEVLPWKDDAEGVVTLDSGVRYRVVNAGEGPTAEQTVVFSKFAIATPELKVFESSAYHSQARFGLPIGPEFQPLPFMKELAPVLKQGAYVQVAVPRVKGATAGANIPGFGKDDDEIWAFGVDFVFPLEESYKTTESGLKYIILEEGTGPSPTAADSVRARYRGWTTNGMEFDSSFKSGNTPTKFGLTNVIPGWTEGIPLMKTGGKALFYIPFDLAYGANGRPPRIPPRADLIFWVELVEVVGAPKAPDAPKAPEGGGK